MAEIERWETPDSVRNTQLIFVGILIVFLYFVQATLPSDSAAPIFISIFVMGVLLTIISGSTPLGWGNNIKHAIDAFIIGGAAILLMAFFRLGIKIAIPVALPFSLGSVFSVFYISVVAAFVEEFVFRERLTPFYSTIFGNFFIANVGQAITFGLFHLAAYAPFAVSQGIPIESLLLEAAIFGGAASLGNIILKSSAFGLGMHFTNNVLALSQLS